MPDLEPHTDSAQMKPLMRFIATGVAATCIHFVVAILAIELVRLSPPIANSLAFVAATIFSYLVNTYWSFQTESTLQNAVKYWLAACLGFCLAYGLSSLAEYLNWHYLVGIALVVCVVPLVNFLVHSKWTYR